MEENKNLNVDKEVEENLNQPQTSEIKNTEEAEQVSKKERKRQKYLLLLIPLILLTLVGTYFFMQEQKKNQEFLDTIILKKNDNKDLEYSKEKPLDSISLVSVNVEDATIEANIEKIDLSKVGDQEVEYTVKANNGKKELKKVFKETFKIVDTNKPIIELVETEEDITYDKNSDFNPENFIVVVRDEVDGELKKSDKQENGTYVIDNQVDVSKAGEYKVVVKATDINGNKSEKDFKVLITEKECEPKTIIHKAQGYYEKKLVKDAWSEVVNHKEEYKTINHKAEGYYEKQLVRDAWSETVNHPAEYKTVHHDAVVEKVIESTYSTCPGGYFWDTVLNEYVWHDEEICGEVQEWVDKVVKEAWDEQILVKDSWSETVNHPAEYKDVWIETKAAWSEQVLVKDAYSETVNHPATYEDVWIETKAAWTETIGCK